jgi:catechol 2,3-dioxygenase-like lactoylglutathione lyase family enzyme
MKVRAIDFVELRVADVDRSLRFYRDILGMDFPPGGTPGAWLDSVSPQTPPRNCFLRATSFALLPDDIR